MYQMSDSPYSVWPDGASGSDSSSWVSGWNPYTGDCDGDVGVMGQEHSLGNMPGNKDLCMNDCMNGCKQLLIMGSNGSHQS